MTEADGSTARGEQTQPIVRALYAGGEDVTSIVVRLLGDGADPNDATAFG